MTPESAPWRLDQSQDVTRHFRRLYQAAERLGHGPAFLAAATTIIRCLENDPVEFGEPRYRLKASGLWVRAGCIRPLQVSFVPHEAARVVIVSHFVLMSLDPV
jgi:hypothetical protein